jgi:hypothetical protein
MKEIQLSCAWCDSESLKRELAPYVGNTVRFNVRTQVQRFRGSGIDNTVLVALVTGGSVAVSALITALIQWRAKKAPDGTGKIVLKSSSGITVEVPRDFSDERLREIIEIAQTLDRPRIYIE